MKCDEAMNRSAGLALGDLEAGDLRLLEEHLVSCGSCRASAEQDARTVAALRADAAVEGSEGRRERAVAAMVAARRKTGEEIPRRRWIAASLAAAMLLALTVPLLLSRGGLSVIRQDGAAWVQRAGSGDYVTLRLGDTLRAGDLLKTESVVGLEGLHGLKVVVNRNSRIMFDDRGRTPVMHLSEGAVYVETPNRDLTVVDELERRATLRDGRFEVRRPIVASGSGEKKAEFVVQVDKGVALLTGAGGAREAKDGEQWSVDGAGSIRDEKPDALAPWRKQP